ncbi:MAG: ABC transporter substrate-binding protein [Candidatus Faecivicinus sp.]|nr:ABC transporter substrate-binding protein [Candidatus Faecivicinus sp.]
MKKTLITLLLAVALLASALGTAAFAEENVHLVFWHGMSGTNGEIIDYIVRTFNESHPGIEIEAQYQGSYEESINKLKAAMRTGDGPDMIQIYEAGTRFMVDSGFVNPVQNLIDKYSIDVSHLEEHILDYYTVNDQLYSMPLNTSIPVLYYNADMLRAIGFEGKPQTWDDIIDISIKVREAGLADSGIAVSNFAWWFEQVLVQQRYPMVDNDNGRSAAATRCTLMDGDVALKMANKWLDMYKNGYIANIGFNVADNNAYFWAGQTAMAVDSSGGLRNFLTNIGDSFELGVAFFPAVDAESPNGGVTLGGASIYMINNDKGEAYEKAVAEFIRYIITPEIQSYFHVNSGYFPVTTEAYELDEVKQNLEKYPQFQTIVDQLHFSENMGFGAIYGTMVEGRAVYVGYLQQMLLGELTPEEALNKSVEDVNVLIEDYNLANG